VKPRRHFLAEEKATILRRHLADKVPISDLCEEYHIQSSLFYLWQRQALEHLAARKMVVRSMGAMKQKVVSQSTCVFPMAVDVV